MLNEPYMKKYQHNHNCQSYINLIISLIHLNTSKHLFTSSPPFRYDDDKHSKLARTLRKTIDKGKKARQNNTGAMSNKQKNDVAKVSVLFPPCAPHLPCLHMLAGCRKSTKHPITPTPRPRRPPASKRCTAHSSTRAGCGRRCWTFYTRAPREGERVCVLCVCASGVCLKVCLSTPSVRPDIAPPPCRQASALVGRHYTSHNPSLTPKPSHNPTDKTPRSWQSSSAGARSCRSH